MDRRHLLHIVGWGAAGALALACIAVLWLAPLWFDTGRELAAAAIALLAVAIGFRLAERRSSGRRAAPFTGDAQETAEPRSEHGNAALPQLAGLSPREREILGLLARGLSNKELARALSVSENTVKTHLANLYAKLGVGRRTQALAAAQRLGLATVAGDHPEITRPGDGRD